VARAEAGLWRVGNGSELRDNPRMRYFTRSWANHELSDAEDDQARQAYERRIAEIAPRLPPAMLRLLREVSLHDAIIERVVWRPAKQELKLDLVGVSDLTGYFLVQLTYGGAQLGKQHIAALKRAALSRETELLYDEVDIIDDGRLCHRILFWPNEEVTLDFSQLELSISPRPDKRVDLTGAFDEEVEESDDE
jgi:hypothetical protein